MSFEKHRFENKYEKDRDILHLTNKSSLTISKNRIKKLKRIKRESVQTDIKNNYNTDYSIGSDVESPLGLN